MITMSDPQTRLFGFKEGFGIELARLALHGQAPFSGVCLWIEGKAVDDISSTMALYHLAIDLESLNYIERMDKASTRRLVEMRADAADFSLAHLEESEPRQIQRVSPGECFDDWNVRVVGGAYEVFFFVTPSNSKGQGPTQCYSTSWVLYQPPVREFAAFVKGSIGE